MIEARRLQKVFPGGRDILASQTVFALRGVDFRLGGGDAISLIGKSGCGKTPLGRIVAGLESYTGGDLLFDGVALSSLSPRRRRERLHQVQLIQQDPYAALNPGRTLGNAMADPLKLQAKQLEKPSIWVERRTHELRQLVGLDPTSTLHKYPHNLSGGQRQRLVIARASP